MRLGILLIGVAILVAGMVLAEDPVFLNPPDYSSYALTEDEPISPIYVDANDSDEDYPLDFSSNADDPNVSFSCFNMDDYNDTSAIINFTPDNDCVGAYEVEILVKDTAGEKASPLTLNFSVENVNDPPNITGTSPSRNITISEGTEVDFSYNRSATDVDLQWGDTLLANLSFDGVPGFTDSEKSVWGHTYGYCSWGNHTTTLEVVDGEGETDEYNWSIEVQNDNRPPVLNTAIDNVTMDENEQLVNNISLHEHFYDADWDECTGRNKDMLAFNVTNTTHINITIDEGNVSFYPDPYWNGEERVTFTVSDGYSSVRSNNVTVTVNSINDPPNITYIPDQVTAVGANYTLDLSEYVIHPDDDPLNYSTNNSRFSSTLDGLISEIPEIGGKNYTINVTVTDGVHTDWRTFNLTVQENAIPHIGQIPHQNATEGEFFEMFVNATDTDSEDTLDFSISGQMLSAETVNSSPENGRGRFSFTPEDPETGNHTLTVTVTDSKGAFNRTQFNLTVHDINNPPEWETIPPQNPRVNFSYSFDATQYVSDKDRDDTISFSDNASFFDIASDTGMISFTHNTTLATNVVLSATDGINVSNTTVFFNITVNRPPKISPHNATCFEDVPCTIMVGGSDPDGDTLNFSIDSDGSDSNLTFERYNRTAMYLNITPNASQVGSYNIPVNVSDPYNATNSTYLNLTINETNDPPRFTEISNMTLHEHRHYLISIEAYDGDCDTLTFGVNTTMFNITVNRSNCSGTQGLINFTPGPPDVGNHTLFVNVTDGVNTTGTLVNYLIVNESDPPVITDISPPSPLDVAEGVEEDFTFSFDDPDSMEHDFEWLYDSAQVGASQNFSRFFGYCEAGSHTLSVNVTDESNLSDTASWDINVTNTNRPPQLVSPVPNLTIRQGEYIGNVTDIDSHLVDLDHENCTGANKDELNFTPSRPANVTLFVDPDNHTLSVRANPSFVGVVPAHINVSDGSATTSSNTFYINVTQNSPPNITALLPYRGDNGTIMDAFINRSDARGLLNFSVDEGERLNFSVRGEDPENDTLAFTWYDDEMVVGTHRNLSLTFAGGSTGTHEVTCNVSDGVVSDSVTWNVTVRKVNHPPTYGVIEYEEFEGGTYTRTNGSSHLALARDGAYYHRDGGYLSRSVDLGTDWIKPRLGTISWNAEQTDETVDAADEANLSTNGTQLTSVSRVHDDDPATYWMSSSQEDTLTMELNHTVAIHNITLQLPSNASTDYEILMSSGGNYTVYSSHTGAAGTVTESFPSPPASSVRVRFTSSMNVTVYEISVNSAAGVFIRTRTSPDEEEWSGLSDIYYNGSGIESQRSPTQSIRLDGNTTLWEHRFLEFFVNMTTVNISETPVLEGVTMTYDFPDVTLPEDYNTELFSLDNYFTDPDNDSLGFYVEDVSRSANLGLTIDNESNTISVNPVPDWYGTAIFSIVCCDDRTCVESRNISVTLYDVEDPPPPEQEGSGGSTSTERVIVPKPIPENVTQPEFLQLLNPEPVIKATETEVVVPLTLRNGGNETLHGIQLGHSTDANVSVRYDSDNFESLAPGVSEDVVLTISMDEGQDPFLVNASATAQRPELYDSTAITITPVPKENLNETVRFVRDLLSSNPECLELNEHLQEAQDLIEEGNEKEAQSLLGDTVDACRYLISKSSPADEKNMTEEKPQSVQDFVSRNRGPLLIIASILGILIVVSAALMIAASRYNRPSS